MVLNQELLNPGYIPTTLGSTYNQALAIIVATAMGDREYAHQLCASLLPIYDLGFHGAFDVYTGSDLASDEYIGNNSWVLLALCHFKKKFGDDTYAALASKIAIWLLDLYNDGPFAAGSSTLANMIITEGQIDAIAALRAYESIYEVNLGGVPDSAEDYLFTTLRNGDRFYAGSTNNVWDTTQYLDTSLWGSLATTRYAAQAAEMISNLSDMVYTIGDISGYMDIQGSNRIFVPGFAYWALVTGNPSYTNLMRLYTKQSTLSGAGIAINSNNPVWVGADTSPNAETTLWFLLASLGVNPFIP